jgi:hypothetical protein
VKLLEMRESDWDYVLDINLKEYGDKPALSSVWPPA